MGGKLLPFLVTGIILRSLYPRQTILMVNTMLRNCEFLVFESSVVPSCFGDLGWCFTWRGHLLLKRAVFRLAFHLLSADSRAHIEFYHFDQAFARSFDFRFLSLPVQVSQELEGGLSDTPSDFH